MRHNNTVRKILTAVLTLGVTVASAQQAPRPGLSQERIDELSHKHDGYLGALAPENLAKKRPKAGFNLTGTWFIDLRRDFKRRLYLQPTGTFNKALERFPFHKLHRIKVILAGSPQVEDRRETL